MPRKLEAEEITLVKRMESKMRAMGEISVHKWFARQGRICLLRIYSTVDEYAVGPFLKYNYQETFF